MDYEYVGGFTPPPRLSILVEYMKYIMKNNTTYECINKINNYCNKLNNQVCVQQLKIVGWVTAVVRCRHCCCCCCCCRRCCCCCCRQKEKEKKQGKSATTTKWWPQNPEIQSRYDGKWRSSPPGPEAGREVVVS